MLGLGISQAQFTKQQLHLLSERQQSDTLKKVIK